MKTWVVFFLASSCMLQLSAQRKIAEMSIEYDLMLIRSDRQSTTVNPMNGSQYTVLLKGPYSRTELRNPLFSTITLHDDKQQTAVVLKELSGQKLLIRLNTAQWVEKNMKYEGLVFTEKDSSRSIMDYQAKQAIATLKDGSFITVWYTATIDTENKSYDPLFTSLKGLPLEWEIQQGTTNLHYTVRKISTNPIPASRFDIPKTGYREMSYEESKKGL